MEKKEKNKAPKNRVLREILEEIEASKKCSFPHWRNWANWGNWFNNWGNWQNWTNWGNW